MTSHSGRQCRTKIRRRAFGCLPSSDDSHDAEHVQARCWTFHSHPFEISSHRVSPRRRPVTLLHRYSAFPRRPAAISPPLRPVCSLRRQCPLNKMRRGLRALETAQPCPSSTTVETVARHQPERAGRQGACTTRWTAARGVRKNRRNSR
jgi:hypothetical protein